MIIKNATTFYFFFSVCSVFNLYKYPSELCQKRCDSFFLHGATEGLSLWMSLSRSY